MHGNGTTQENHHPLDDELADRVTGTSDGEPSRVTTLLGKATEMVTAHPIAAAAIALGLGYFLVRTARR